MKNNKLLFSLTFVILLAITALFFSSFDSGKLAYGAAPDAKEVVHVSETVVDAVSGTGNDTTYVGAPAGFICNSLFSYQHILYGVQDTATMNVICILQESAFDSGEPAKWYEVERDTLITGSNPVIFNGGLTVDKLAYVKGKRQRIIYDGVTSATQDVTITRRSVLKKLQ